MEKKNTLLLTVIAVATLLVAVVGATFAYFASAPNVTSTLNVTATTAAPASLIATTENPIVLNITAANMLQQSDATKYGVVAQTSAEAGNVPTVTVSLTGGVGAACEYSIKYFETGSAKYSELKTNITTAATDYTTYGTKEFTIAGSGTSDGSDSLTAYTLAETNLDVIVGTNNGVAVADVPIVVEDATKAITHTWKFDAKFYNRDVDQNDVSNKTFTGYFQVDADCNLDD